MRTHDEMVRFQADHHYLIGSDAMTSNEEYIGHLTHVFAYSQARSILQGRKVLDLGCNTGYGTAMLSRFVADIHALDVSERALSAARQSYGNLGINFVHYNGREIPFAENTFSGLSSFQVIEHVVDTALYLSEGARVLAPCGIALFTTPNSVLRIKPGMGPWNETHVREYSPDELKDVLQNHFKYVRVFGLFAEEMIYDLETKRIITIRDNFGVPRSLTKKIGDALGFPARKWKRHQTLKKLLYHGIETFFYRDHDLDGAIDLLAICSNDQAEIEKCAGKLSIEYSAKS